MLSVVEQSRLSISKTTDRKIKSIFGQFFTPAKTAQFMAGLFIPTNGKRCRLLDAGAGIGSLSAAFLERCVSGDLTFSDVEVDAFEIDKNLHSYLSQTLEGYKTCFNVKPAIQQDDFIYTAVDSISGSLFAQTLPKYSHAILNPPYRKIRNHSHYYSALTSIGLQTVNLYSAFTALSLSLLNENGQLVAILPRSFCNGPYYKSFRDYILSRSAIKHIHLFTSRNKAFKDDNVLQENVIIMLECGSVQNDVVITTSTDDTYADVEKHTYPFNRIVFPDDSERFIHIPISPERNEIELSTFIRYSLDEIEVNVSTGPVVDFRLKSYLRDMPESNTVPLLYPGHFKDYQTDWPQPGFKKPNAVLYNQDTKKWLYPNGFYCVVRRFSAKEEKRRIVASVVNPNCFPDAKMIGFENHLNVFHFDKQGLPELLAQGLAVYLNSTAVDENFRRYSGHTQVNANDLRLMKYPSRKDLIAIGTWAKQCEKLTQGLIDEQVRMLNA